MNRSNIFVLIELTKLSENLSVNTTDFKNQLKRQSSYFNIISAKYFSDALSAEWEKILEIMKNKGEKYNGDGTFASNAIVNTIDQMSVDECILIINRINRLLEELRKEF